MSEVRMESLYKTKKIMDRFLPRPKGFASKAIQNTDCGNQESSKPLVTPIYQCIGYCLDDQLSSSSSSASSYRQPDNPTRVCLEKSFKMLDEANYSICFSSNRTAITALLHVMRSGQHILACCDIYGGSYQIFTDSARRFGIDTTFVDFSDLTLVKSCIRPNTALVWLESVTNPLLRVFDIRKIVETIRSVRNDIIIVVDNTFLTPYFLRPLSLGADIAMYSYSGHGDVGLGLVTINDKQIFNRLRDSHASIGVFPAAMDCYLVLRSLKTLQLRMEKHFKNGIIIAKFLESHCAVGTVYHPGLISHPNHTIAIKQSSGHTGLVAFYLKCTDLAMTKKVLSRLKIIKTVMVVNIPQSTITIPTLMFSSQIPPEYRMKLRITDNLLLLSVGLEEANDLLYDLDNALSICC